MGYSGRMDQQQRIERVRSSLRSLKEQEIRFERAGPPCLKCAHFIGGAEKVGPPPVCGHLVYTTREMDPITGKIVEKTGVSAERARSEHGSCGPEALLFEKAPLLVRANRKAVSSSFIMGAVFYSGLAAVTYAFIT